MTQLAGLTEAARRGEADWEPSVLVFACTWCSYAGADTAGVSRMQQQPNFRIIRTMCSGRIQPGFVLRAFEKGADGVLVSGCHLGDCHYQFGNHRAIEQFEKTTRMVKLLGLEPGRLRLEWISAAEGGRFAQVVNEFIDQVRGLGPSPFARAGAPRANGGRQADDGAGAGPALPADRDGGRCGVTGGRVRDTAASATASRAWACYDCGKCTAVCPLTRVGSGFSPRREVLARSIGPGAAGPDDRALFACLSCGQCSERCPADVDYPQLVLHLREAAHRSGVEPECPHGGSLQSVMRMMARGTTEQDRLGWLDGDLETEPARGDVLYFAGCAPYYDAFFPEYRVNALGGARAAIKILNRLGIRPVVSGAERCCGHDLLWNGDRISFEALARHNAGLVAQSGAKLIVSSCAECVRTWRIDYQPFLGGRQVRTLHISELIAERLGDLELGSKGDRRITFHDPCRLGRHLGSYDAPRTALRALPGVELGEMRRHGRDALCCAGGTWSNCDKHAKRIQVDRLRQARDTGADVLATACPKCQIHFRCAMQDPGRAGEIGVEMRDIGELVADALL